MKELVSATGISRKILDRHRRYIIAAVEILSGDYPLLAEYMQFIKDYNK
jgi:RNA polymerase sigma factor